MSKSPTHRARILHEPAMLSGKPFTALILEFERTRNRVLGIAVEADLSHEAEHARKKMLADLLQERGIDEQGCAHMKADLTAFAREAGYDGDEPGWDRAREAG